MVDEVFFCFYDQISRFFFFFSGVTSDYTIQVNSTNTNYSKDFLESKYIYEMNHCEIDHRAKSVKIIPRKYQYFFRTQRQVPRTGVMLVGWGGNNGSTFTGATIANREKLTWMRKGSSLKFHFYFLKFNLFIQKVNNIRTITVR